MNNINFLRVKDCKFGAALMEYNIAMSVVPTEDKTLMTSILANRALVLNKVKLPKNAIDVSLSFANSSFRGT